MSLGVAPSSLTTRRGAGHPLLGKIATFGAVGLVATAVHLSVAWVLLGPVGGLGANAAGFVAGLAVTYLGNYFATFKSQAAHGPTLIRFLVVSAATLAVSEWTLVALHAMAAEERVGLVIAIVLLPLLRFGLLARQVFVPSDGQASLSNWLVDIGVWSGSVGVGLLAFWAVTPAGFLDPGSPLWAGVPVEEAASEAATTDGWWDLTSNWRTPLALTSDEAAVAVAPAVPVAALATRAAWPLLGDDLNHLPAWFLLSFSAAGPSAIAVMRQLSIRRTDVLLAGVALAVAVTALAFRTLHPALSGVFLVLLVVAAALRLGRAQPPWSGPVVLSVAVVAALSVHPFLAVTSCTAGLVHLRRDHGQRQLDAS